MSWQQINREHSHKKTDDNGEDGQHLEGVETGTKTGETDQRVTVHPSRGATWHPTWAHTWLTGVPALELSHEA
jgi:hypothetical protein